MSEEETCRDYWNMTNYTCGTCGVKSLIIRGKHVGDQYPSPYEWSITCGRGHVLFPYPGMEIFVNEDSK